MNKVILKGSITSKWINDKQNFGNISLKIEDGGKFVSYVSVKVFANKINDIEKYGIGDEVSILGRVQRNKINEQYSTDIVLNFIKGIKEISEKVIETDNKEIEKTKELPQSNNLELDLNESGGINWEI